MAVVKSKTRVRGEFKLNNGVDSEGNTLYKSKSIPDIKGNADPQSIYNTMEAFKTVLRNDAVAYYVSDVFKLGNE